MAVNGLSSNGLRMAGLASGLDTENIVKQMSALTKGRINYQQQKLDKLKWKQDAYRDVISKITAFKDTYLSYAKPETNIASSSLFGARTATSTNPLLKVIAKTNAAETTYNVSEVVQKASAANISSSGRAVDGINLDFNATTGVDYTVKVILDGSSKNVTFTGGADAAGTQTNFLNALNTQFSSTGVTFGMTDNRLTTTDAAHAGLVHTYSIESTTTLKTELSALGLSANSTSSVSTYKKLGDLAFATALQGNGFAFEINGESFKFSRDATLKNVIDEVNNSDAGVKLSFDALKNEFKLETTESGSASSLEINQTAGNLLTAT